MKIANLLDEVKAAMNIVETISAQLGDPITADDYIIENLGCSHRKPKNLPKGYAAVYMFAYKGEWLKIGKANSKSVARYTSQHYGFNAMSTLAKSLASDNAMGEYALSRENAREWIEQNTYRVNVLIGNEKGKAATELVEAVMHYKFRPRYEGAI